MPNTIEKALNALGHFNNVQSIIHPSDRHNYIFPTFFFPMFSSTTSLGTHVPVHLVHTGTSTIHTRHRLHVHILHIIFKI